MGCSCRKRRRHVQIDYASTTLEPSDFDDEAATLHGRILGTNGVGSGSSAKPYRTLRTIWAGHRAFAAPYRGAGCVPAGPAGGEP